MKTEIYSVTEVEKAAQRLRDGELIAFPTETVYGLGAPLFLPDSVKNIFSVKGRPQDNPLIVHLSDLSWCEQIAASLPPSFFLLANVFFPGPLTLIVQKHPRVSSIVSAGLDTLAIRMPKNDVALKLISATGQPLVAPSANRSGYPSSTCLEHVLSDFSGKIAGIVDGGPCLHGIESTVVDLVSFSRPTLLRPGVVTKEELEGVLGEEVDLYSKGPKASPGMKYRHYAPKATVKLLRERGDLEEYLKRKSKPFILSTSPLSHPYFFLEAETLYARLRDADQKGYTEIVVFCDKKLDPALANRLEKITHEDNHH